MFLAPVIILSSIFNRLQAEPIGKGNISDAYENNQNSQLCEGMSLEKCEEQNPQLVKSCKICGITNDVGLTETVVNGKTVDPPNLYPWMVTLLVKENKHCGGAIINEKFILTAAHCLTRSGSESGEGQEAMTSQDEYFEPDELRIGFLTSTYDIQYGPDVEEIIPHPEFTMRNMKHDIALIKLEKKIACDANKNPICLPTVNLDIPINTVLHISGWGSTDARVIESSDRLQEGRVRLTNFSRCDEHVSSKLKSYSYCLSSINRQGPCFGDSGGSMFLKENNKVISVGVASLHTSQTCSEGKPFLYAAIPKYVEWINQITGVSQEKQQ